MEEMDYSKLFDLQEKKVMITGGAKGIGYTIAKAYYALGAKIALIDISPETSATALEIDPSGENVFAVIGNLVETKSRETAFFEALEKLGGTVDVLVNSAGMTIRNEPENMTEEQYDKVLDLNAKSLYFTCQLAGREMIKQQSGKIINVTSILGKFGSKASSGYSASKGAVAQITKSLAAAWAPKGINVNAIAPAWINTELTIPLRQNKEVCALIDSRIPIGRWMELEDIVGPAVYLASSASDYIVGEIMMVDGGVSVHLV